MASAQGPELAIAVCKAGGLGSLPAAMLTPDRLREQIDAIRQATDAPFNVNFFTHGEPSPIPRSRRAGASDSRLTTPRRASIHPPSPPRRSARPSTRPCARSLKRCGLRSWLSFRPAAYTTRQGGRRAADRCVRNDRRRGALARTQRSRRRHRSGAEAGGHRGMFLTDDVDRQQPGLIRILRSARRRAAAGGGGRRDQRWTRNRGSFRARRRRDPDRHGLSHSPGDDFAAASRRARERQRRCNPAHQRVHRAPGARPRQPVRRRGRADVQGRAPISFGGGSGRAVTRRRRKARQRRFFATLGGRGGGACARGGRRGADAAAVGGRARGDDGVERALEGLWRRLAASGAGARRASVESRSTTR